MSMLPMTIARAASPVAQRFDFLGDRLRLAIVGGNPLEHREPLAQVGDLAFELGLAWAGQLPAAPGIAPKRAVFGHADVGEADDRDNHHDRGPEGHCNSPCTAT